MIIQVKSGQFRTTQVNFSPHDIYRTIQDSFSKHDRTYRTISLNITEYCRTISLNMTYRTIQDSFSKHDRILQDNFSKHDI